MIRRPPRSTQSRSSAASDVYKRQKGAVEEVFAACKYYAIDGETGPLDESHFAQAQETTAKLNADGFRVIAVAFKEMPPAQATYSVKDEAGLTLLGYIAFLDPPKETCLLYTSPSPRD